MKKTLARKLTLKLAIILFAVMALLIIGSYHAVSHIVRTEISNYNEAVAGILSDMIWSEADGMHLPLDAGLKQEIDLYSDYICLWYRVDYTYVYSASETGEELTLLGFSTKDNWENVKTAEAFGEVIEAPPGFTGYEEGEDLVGVRVRHTPTLEEQKLLNREMYVLTQETERFEKGLEALSCVRDEYGNTVIVAVSIFLDKIDRTIWNNYWPVVLVIFGAFVVMTALIYYFIRKGVFKPAKEISESMKAFIADGKRTDVRLPEGGDDEFAMISKAFNTMTGNIDQYVHDINRLTGAEERQRAEVSIAADIQKGFLSGDRMSTGEYEIAARMTPARDVGGDLYDYMPVGDHRVLLTIGDVSGKGLASSMYMAVTLVLIRQFASMGLGPAEILEKTNNAISDRNPNMLFVTAFVAIFDTETGVLTYANAGHNPPYLLRNRAECLTGAKNMLLGLYKGETYVEESVKLSAGDILFLYTDGVNEATNAGKRFFGDAGLRDTLDGFRETHEENLVEYVYRAVSAFADGAEQSDDITMLAFTVKRHTELRLKPEAEQFEEIKKVLLAADLPREFKLKLCVAAEEIFLNIAAYAFKGRDKSSEEVRFTFEHFDRIVLKFEDGGVPYDPTENVIEAEDYDPDEQLGGLGKLIAFTIADEVHYENTDGKNRLTITKYLKEEEK